MAKKAEKSDNFFLQYYEEVSTRQLVKHGNIPPSLKGGQKATISTAALHPQDCLTLNIDSGNQEEREREREASRPSPEMFPLSGEIPSSSCFTNACVERDNEKGERSSAVTFMRLLGCFADEFYLSKANLAHFM